MKKTLLAALAAPSLLLAMTFSPAASAQQYRGPSYSGDAEGQIAYQQSQERRQYHYGAPSWESYAYRDAPRWQRNERAWQRRGLDAAPRGYRCQRYDRHSYAPVRRSDGAIVQWRHVR